MFKKNCARTIIRANIHKNYTKKKKLNILQKEFRNLRYVIVGTKYTHNIKYNHSLNVDKEPVHYGVSTKLNFGFSQSPSRILIWIVNKNIFKK